MQADPKLAILLFLLILSLYGQIRWRNESEDGRERIWQKNRHLGGLAAIQSYFLLAFFPFLTLPSRSSVNSAIYTVPALSCRLYRRHTYTFVRFVWRYGGRGRKEKTGQVHRTAFSVGGRDDRLWMVLSSTSFYFIGCNLAALYFICSRLSRDLQRL